MRRRIRFVVVQMSRALSIARILKASRFLTAPFLMALAVASHGGQTVLVLGDSLSSAYNIPVSSGWVSLLADRIDEYKLRWEVVNASISGDTTSGGRSRLPQLLQEHSPAIVVIELGGNDGLRATPIGSIRDNLVAMIEQSLDADAAVVLAGMQLPPSYGRRYTEQFRELYIELQNEFGIVLIPFFLEEVGDNPELMQGDGIHPTEEAQPLILELVWPHLEPLL